MLPLNLPPFKYKVRTIDEKTYIFDVFRKKYVVLTPEEWVRQHVGNLLLMNKYPQALIKLEAGTKYNKLEKRTDIRVYDREGNLFMLVECKAPSVKIDAKTANQAALYGKSLLPKYIFLSNGLNHYLFEMNYNSGEILTHESLPVFL